MNLAPEHEPAPVATSATLVPRSNPFQGLAYFESAQASSFGGRTRDIQDLASEILRSRKLILYGRSGLGKTSLLLAGVLPKLREHRCHTVYLRVLLDPARELFSAAHEQLGGNLRDDLPSLIRQHDREGPVVIVFDQFEEFFIRFSERPNAGDGERAGRTSEDRQLQTQFMEVLTQLAQDSELDLRLVFSLREDWFAEMESFEEFLPSIMRSSYRLLPLTAFGVRESITRMLKVGGVPFEPQLVSGLVEQLAEASFDPAMLQVLCTETWSRAAERSGGQADRLELQDLNSVGSLNSVFARYLDQVRTHIPQTERHYALQVRAVLAALITPQQTKHASPRNALLEDYFKINDTELERVLQLLLSQGLVREDQRRDGPWYELIHERLIRSILKWLELDDEFFRFRNALNTVRTLSSTPGWSKRPDSLLNKGQLAGVVGPYKELLNFTEQERQFLLHSAIYYASDDLPHWAAQLDVGQLQRAVQCFLAFPSAEARIRGAEAVRVLPQLEQLAGAMHDLALEDSVAEVRQAAARAFARRIRDSELPALARELSLSPQPPYLLDLTAQLLRAWRPRLETSRLRKPYLLDLAAEVLRERGAHAPLSWGWYWGWRAQRQLFRRRRQERAVAVAIAKGRVLLPAVGASLLGGFIFVPLVVYWSLCVTSPKDVTESDSLYVVLMTSAGAVMYGTGFAWHIGRRAIACAVRYDEQGQLGRALCSPILGWLSAAAALVSSLVAVLGDDKPSESIAVGLACALTGATLLGWMSAIGRLARASVVPASSILARWGWAAVWSLGGTFGPALWTWLALGTGRGRAYLDWLDSSGRNAVLKLLTSYPAFAMLAAPAVAFLSFAGLATIASASPLLGRDCDYRVAPDPSFAPRQVRRQRRIGASLLASALAAFSIAHGLDIFPWSWTARHLRLEPGTQANDQIVLSPGPAPEDTAFVRLELSSARPSLVHERRTRGGALAPPSSDAEAENRFGLYPSGSSLLPPVHFTRKERAPVTLDLELLPPNEDATLRTHDWQFYTAKFSPSESAWFAPQAWNGKLELKVETDATALRACFTGVALWKGESLRFWRDDKLQLRYGDPGKPDQLVELTAGNQAVELSELIRPPGSGLELEQIWRRSLRCDEMEGIQAGHLSAELPRLMGAESQTSYASRASRALLQKDIYLLFLVRADREAPQPSAAP